MAARAAAETVGPAYAFGAGLKLLTMTPQTPYAMCELHSRSSDGITVRLLWSKHDGRTEVSVVDTREGHAFTVEVRDGDGALDVFHHPYAYAAWLGIDTREVLPGRVPDRADQALLAEGRRRPRFRPRFPTRLPGWSARRRAGGL